MRNDNYDVSNSPHARGATLVNTPDPVRQYGDRSPRTINPRAYTGSLTPRQHSELLRGPSELGPAFLDDDDRQQAWHDHGERIVAQLAAADVDACWASETYGS